MFSSKVPLYYSIPTIFTPKAQISLSATIFSTLMLQSLFYVSSFIPRRQIFHKYIHTLYAYCIHIYERIEIAKNVAPVYIVVPGSLQNGTQDLEHNQFDTDRENTQGATNGSGGRDELQQVLLRSFFTSQFLVTDFIARAHKRDQKD